ncbi:MAG TPA: SapB/AmfS family lanthipeptide [Pseudonocardiaceae bacterium]|nr:SapB/AmfS family lanthipeptide [Pseudonocardiaceae bacterium]
MEHVLELQELDTPEVMDNDHGGNGGGSRVSLLLCGGSTLSLTSCE